MAETFTDAHHQLNTSMKNKASAQKDNMNAVKAVQRYCKNHVPTKDRAAVVAELMAVLGLV